MTTLAKEDGTMENLLKTTLGKVLAIVLIAISLGAVALPETAHARCANDYFDKRC